MVTVFNISLTVCFCSFQFPWMLNPVHLTSQNSQLFSILKWVPRKKMIAWEGWTVWNYTPLGSLPKLCLMVARFQVVAGDLVELQLLSTRQRSVTLERTATLEGSGIHCRTPRRGPFPASTAKISRNPPPPSLTHTRVSKNVPTQNWKAHLFPMAVLHDPEISENMARMAVPSLLPLHFKHFPPTRHATPVEVCCPSSSC